MIPPNINPKMSGSDVIRFYENVNRQLNGNFTQKEIRLRKRAGKTYKAILKSNGGKNPILGF